MGWFLDRAWAAVPIWSKSDTRGQYSLACNNLRRTMPPYLECYSYTNFMRSES